MFDALADLLVYGWGSLTPGIPQGAAVHCIVMDVAKVLVLLALTIYAMGLLRALPKSEKVRELIRNRSDLQGCFGGGASTCIAGVMACLNCKE
jgi:uncharacterized membrane protein YraQ (UPF0718 family)